MSLSAQGKFVRQLSAFGRQRVFWVNVQSADQAMRGCSLPFSSSLPQFRGNGDSYIVLGSGKSVIGTQNYKTKNNAKVHVHCSPNGTQWIRRQLPRSQFKGTNQNELDQLLTRLKTGTQIRHFHATRKNEILPIVGVALFAFVARYSYKALQRMEMEWEEYQDALEEYNKATNGKNPKTRTAWTTREVSRRRMGIDVGSSNIRISHFNHGKSLDIVNDREGYRYTPALILREDESDDFVLGRLAKARRYDRSLTSKTSSQVFNPQRRLLTRSGEGKEVLNAYRAIVRAATYNAMEKLNVPFPSTGIGSDYDGPIFMADSDVRPVFSYPPAFAENKGTNGNMLKVFQDAVVSLVEDGNVNFVSEPIAAVVAAEHFKFFPSSSPTHPPKGDILVVDVGGSCIALSLVHRENVMDPRDGILSYHRRMEGVGGDALLTALVNFMAREFYGTDTAPRGAEDVTDGMALQRMYDAAEGSVQELSAGKTRSQVSIPYLSMDFRTHQPKHLEMGISRSVLSKEMDDIVRRRVDETCTDEAMVLSSTLGKPTDLSHLMTSMITKTLEDTNTNPFDLKSVILVGGGGRSPIFQKACEEGLARIAGGQFANDRFVTPPDEKVEELVVLGAALIEESN